MTISLFSIVGMSSCSMSDEDPDSILDSQTVAVNLTMSVNPLTDIASRSDKFTDEELSESQAATGELITDWIVIVLKNNVVVAVAENDINITQSGVWNDRVNLELPKGSYTALAFANMNKQPIKDALPLDTDLTDSSWKDYIIQLTTSDLIQNGKIPMSGYLENYTVRGSINERFAIELVRMLSKVEFAFKNLSQDPVTVSEISLNPVYDGDIYCFAEYDKKPEPDMEPEYEPRFPAMTDGLSHYSPYKHTLSGFNIPANSSDVSETKRTHFYIKESIAEGNHPTDHFHIGLKLTRGTTTEDASYALAADALKYFYRNDYVLFPIVISDYVPEFEIRDYPPIGGYPVSVKSEGTEFYATFSSSGSFAIKARLRDSNGQTVAVKAYSEGSDQDSYVKYIPDENETFTLKYDAADELWRGNFDVNQDAPKHIVLTFEFYISNPGSQSVGLTYTRTLHLLSATN